MTQAAGSAGRQMRCAVFGAAGGIGGALVAELSKRPETGHLLAVSRQLPQAMPARATWAAADILDEAALATIAASAGGELDLVIVATGILHADGMAPEKDWRDLDAGALARVMAVNAIGPALVMKHFAPLLPRSGRSVFAVLSARVGSISDNLLGGWYGYHIKKNIGLKIIITKD
jgi:NAD(P)-dependent dehydrogenase (short-subunit alcohol dehydrogenase family)